MFDLDPYAILKTSSSASDEEVKAAWRARLREHHPDRFAGAPAPVIAAAEEMTELINGAYTQARAKRQPPKEVPGRGRRKSGKLPKAQSLVRQAQVLIEYADALMGRWRAGLGLIRGRRRGIDEAKKVIEEGRTRKSAIHDLDESLTDTLSNAARQVFETRLLHPVERVLSVVEAAAARVETASKQARGAHASLPSVRQAQEEVRQCVLELKGVEEGRAAVLTEALEEASQKVTQGVRRYEDLLRLAERSAAEALTASRRARELNRAAQSEARSVPACISAARDSVDRALLMAGTAAGLARVEHAAAKEAEELWRAERLLVEAKALTAQSEALDREQLRADEVLSILGQRMEQIKASAQSARVDGDEIMEDVRAARAEFTAERAKFDGIAQETWRSVEREVFKLCSYVSDSVDHVERFSTK